MDGVKRVLSDGKYRWVVLALLSVTYFLMHGSRQVFNASLPQIKVGLAGCGVTDAQLGLSRTIFLFAYGLMVPFAGLAADFFKRKWVIVIGTAMFASSVFFTGFADSMLMLFVLYGLLNGVGQCMIPGPAASLIAQFHEETRSTALSIYQTALYFGVIVASVLAGWLGGLSSDGWRYAFWGFGGVGVVWILVLVLFLRNTPALVAKGEVEDKATFREALSAFFSKPTALLLTFAFGMLVFGSNCFRTWMPAFLQSAAEKGGFALSPASAAFHGVIWFYIGSFLGIAIGARASDRLTKTRPGIRITVMAVGMAISAPAMAAMVYMPNLWLCCVMMFVFGVGGGFFDCNLCAGIFDVIAPRYRAAGLSIYLCGAFFLGCPATAVLGWVGQAFSLQHGIAIFGATYALGAVAIFIARGVFFRRDSVL